MPEDPDVLIWVAGTKPALVEYLTGKQFNHGGNNEKMYGVVHLSVDVDTR